MPATALRHRLAAAASLAALTLLAAGCGEVVPEDGAAASSGSITVVDDMDREVTIDGPVERAVVLNSYANEFVRAIGAGDTVVGVDRVSAERLPYLEISDDEVVSEDLSEINYEAVAELDPDVFILPRNGAWQEAADQLESFGVPVVVATAWDFDVFHETVELLGQVFGETEGADEVAGFYDEIFDLVSTRVEGAEPVSVYWETEQPYLTALPGSGFDQIITAAGGRNVFGDVEAGGDEQSETTVDPAAVVERDPELIVHEFGPAAEPTGQERFDDVRDDLLGRAGWEAISAEREGEVYVTNGWATSGLSKALGALYLATWLHPEEFEDVDPDAYLQRWVEDFQGTEFAGADAYVQKVA
ncbi:ABC transporter substrate-binding protein [Marinitenerispora sediminis]|uniref:ABC transporter substrate-binding protein n=1 Tax=Marinitenerispora sediminis TaxID=1931232 RepID=A0A368SZP8_9ACTN|nr:ABC transporter substrate-binding protein [Marinitenerispora sediminis]RCV48148.1 ABC transporter substrate-binding protein [Marinitenerispora sediminis]RCV49324.1 ABC transporter substrate-binding protein [Marinitenerispora sediminis]RCV51600.1 ABC transporter substrate-binding protein [Marinitenerispora sediminis]